MEQSENEEHADFEHGGVDAKKLVGGGRKVCVYPNSLSSREMESLTALCDTFLPSLGVSDNAATTDESFTTFYRTSASMAGTPDRVSNVLSIVFTWWLLCYCCR